MLTTLIILIVASILLLVSLIVGGTIFALFGDVIVFSVLVWLICRIVKALKKK